MNQLLAVIPLHLQLGWNYLELAYFHSKCWIQVLSQATSPKTLVFIKRSEKYMLQFAQE